MNRSTIAIAIALTGCVADDVTSENVVEQQVDSNNGTSLNGTSLNGTSLNGTSLNGTSLNGTSLNGTSLNGTSLNGTSLNGTSVGSTWTGTAGTASIKLRIDKAVQGTGTNSDLWFFAVSYQTTAGWSPLCGLDATNAPILAVPVAGVWGVVGADTAHYSTSSTQFTWSCRGKTIAKCVELGYKIPKGYSNQLQSCVRLLRADYCGNGTPYTVTGTLLDLYDNVGVQADTEGWDIEAEWGPNGATCITNAGNTRFIQKLQTPPTCIAKLSLQTCGTFRTGTYLIDELPPLSGQTVSDQASQPN